MAPNWPWRPSKLNKTSQKHTTTPPLVVLEWLGAKKKQKKLTPPDPQGASKAPWANQNWVCTPSAGCSQPKKNTQCWVLCAPEE